MIKNFVIKVKFFAIELLTALMIYGYGDYVAEMKTEFAIARSPAATTLIQFGTLIVIIWVKKCIKKAIVKSAKSKYQDVKTRRKGLVIQRAN